MGLPLYLYYVGVALVQFPFGFEFEGSVLLEASTVDNTAALTTATTGQKVEEYDFSSDSNPFNTDWE